jgi:plastocyanin
MGFPARSQIRPVRDRRDRNDGAVRRPTLPLIILLVLVGAACGGPNVVVRSGPTEEVFVPQVVDFEGNVGPGVSLGTDVDGNPHLAYLAFEEEPEDGETPAGEDPSAPKLPAVRHAHLVEDVWTRSVVADDQQDVSQEDSTAIAVDEEGVHHTAWTAGGTLYYANNAEGEEFSKPQEVAAEVIGGLSIAAAGGRVAVAFFAGGGGVEGPATLVRVALGDGDGWTVETAAEAGAEEQPATGVGFDGDTVLVAFGDSGRTIVARSGAAWSSETADPNGGVSVSMDVDGDGNPHVAYATPDGQVKHAHSIGGGPWEVTEVGDGAEGPTSIAVDDQGVHHVAWQTAQGVAYATNAEGEFRPEEVPGAEGGAMPRVGAGTDGAVYLAWYDTEGSELVLAVRSDREPLLAVPPPASPTGQPTGQPTGPAPCEPSGTTLTIAAPPGAAGNGFDTDCLAAPAGEAFTIEFDNSDTGQIHNVGIYQTQGGEAFFQGETITAPDTATYEVEAIEEAGQYHFQCDVHPTTMTGTFVVQ